MTSLTYPNAIAPALERRTLTIAFVAALHLAVIYTILVGLQIAPSPLPPDAVFRFIDKHVDPPPQPPLPSIPTHLVDPTQPDAVKPDFDIADPQPTGGRGINVGPGPGAGGDTGPVFRGAMPIASTHTIPDYPALDRRLGHEGTVSLLLDIDADGNVTGATVAQSSGYESLDKAAVAWVRSHWRYVAATKDGVGMPSTARAQVVFQLTRG